jgi:hypothetical protein
MSGSKDILDACEEIRATARGVMRRAGVLERCEYHGLYFDTWADIEDAYRLGNALVSQGKIDLRGQTRRDLTDAIKHELAENTTLGGCPRCDSAMAD